MKVFNVIMGNEKYILGFCLTSEMCKLIGKVMEKNKFAYQGILVTDETAGKSGDDVLDAILYNPDIIILDKNVDKSFKDKIVSKFPGSPIICLPSLSDSVEISSDKVRQISEPFKL
ncbi:MAG: hypothetical protein L0Y76_07320, partial [Ignavibacteria bacterium]|nr:hypothetical protein [Ignavibacteria bacterium]